jgi:hypothetical protein
VHNLGRVAITHSICIVFRLVMFALLDHDLFP